MPGIAHHFNASCLANNQDTTNMFIVHYFDNVIRVGRNKHLFQVMAEPTTDKVQQAGLLWAKARRSTKVEEKKRTVLSRVCPTCRLSLHCFFYMHFANT